MGVDIVEAGRVAGHVLELETRGPWPEHGDPHPKFYVRCSCGYVATARRSPRAAAEAGAGHLRSVTRRAG